MTAVKEIKIKGDDVMVVSPLFKKYVVKTKMSEIDKLIADLKKEKKRNLVKMFDTCVSCLHLYSEKELHEHYEKDDQEWKNWCDDVVLYFGYRAVLWNKVIPIMVEPENILN